MSLGEVDTLNLLTEKLENLFNESQGYYEGFLDANNLYKAGKLSDKEFFAKLGDYTVAYSALEFLAIKVVLEIKKSLDRMAGGQAPGQTQSPGLMPGMGPGGMMAGGMQAPRMGTAASPVGAPPGIISAGQGFAQPGTLPSPDPALMGQPAAAAAPPAAAAAAPPAAAAAAPPAAAAARACAACGAALREGAKFCTKCGSRA